MRQNIKFGIGFIAGRPNVCNIINKYYKYILEQVKEINKKVNFTFFILYDTAYLNSNEEEFYQILPEVYEEIDIKHITSEDIENNKKEIVEIYHVTEEQASLLIGRGYAKSRNTILYEAIKKDIDYLLFWDDDEYPLASVKGGGIIEWIKQKNVLQHLKYIENADITFGYRCGMINPLPYVQFNDTLTKDVYKDFVEALENDAVSWDRIQFNYKNDSGIGFADKAVAEYEKEVIQLEDLKKEPLFGSGMCLNLRHIDKIPAFYNPPNARGEDTFFSCALANLDAKILKIPVYHFHDAYLKFQFLMDEKFPKRLRKVVSDDNGVKSRFLKTTSGWIKYKPLLYYINDRENYRQVMDESKEKLQRSAEKVSTAFNECDLSNLATLLEEYDKNVEKHYNEYIQTNEIWNKIKNKIITE